MKNNEHEYVRDSVGRFTKRLQSRLNLTGEPIPIPHRLTGTASTDNTRPTSSLSNFELIDDKPQTHSPFELTPSASPNKMTPIELTNGESTQEVEEDTTHMPNEHIDPFHGDKEDENPEDFLRLFYRRMGTATEETKKQQFRNFLQAENATDEWFDKLSQQDKKDWKTIEDAFRTRWLRKKAAKKTTEEYEEEITGLQLKMEDLGIKEKTARREVYSHIAWADKMTTIVKGAKIETMTTYISHVRKELPKILREKVGVAQLGGCVVS